MIATNTPLIDPNKLTLPVWRISPELAAKFLEHSESAGSLLARNHQFEKEKIDTSDGAAEISLAKIRERRDAIQDCRLKILQSLVDLLWRRAELVDAAVANLTESAAAAEKDLESLKSKIAKQFEKCGSGLETMIAWPKMPKSAEIQFSHIVARNVSVKSASEDLASAAGVSREGKHSRNRPFSGKFWGQIWQDLTTFGQCLGPCWPDRPSPSVSCRANHVVLDQQGRRPSCSNPASRLTRLSRQSRI